MHKHCTGYFQHHNRKTYTNKSQQSRPSNRDSHKILNSIMKKLTTLSNNKQTEASFWTVETGNPLQQLKKLCMLREQIKKKDQKKKNLPDKSGAAWSRRVGLTLTILQVENQMLQIDTPIFFLLVQLCNGHIYSIFLSFHTGSLNSLTVMPSSQVKSGQLIVHQPTIKKIIYKNCPTVLLILCTACAIATSIYFNHFTQHSLCSMRSI